MPVRLSARDRALLRLLSPEVWRSTHAILASTALANSILGLSRLLTRLRDESGWTESRPGPLGMEWRLSTKGSEMLKQNGYTPAPPGLLLEDE